MATNIVADSRFKTCKPRYTHKFEWIFEKFSVIDLKTTLSCPKFSIKDGSSCYITYQKVVLNSKEQSVLCVYNSSTNFKVTGIKVELCDQSGNVLLRPTVSVYNKENTNAFSFPHANYNATTGCYVLSVNLPDNNLILIGELIFYQETLTTEGYNPALLKSLSSKSNLSTLSSDFKNLFESSLGADITLIVKGTNMLAHKSVLLARSEVFAKMFLSDMKEKSSGVIEIDDIDPRVFKLLLQYFYTGVCSDCDLETAQALYKAADKYSVFELKEALVSVLVYHISPENAASLLAFADLLDDKTLRDEIAAFIRFHLEEIPNIDNIWKIFDDINSDEHAADLVQKLCLGKKS